LKGASTEELLGFFRSHQSYNAKRNRKRLEEIQLIVPLTNDAAILESSVLMTQTLCRQMKTTIDVIKKLEQEIERLCQAHPDFFIFNSFPASGDNIAPRLLAAFGSIRQRFEHPDDAAKYFGIAPAMERSGTSTLVRWRYFCPLFLRQSIHEFANQSIHHSFWAGEFYKRQRARGKEHQVAVRALAFKWIRIMFRCWQDRKPYNEATYLKALQRGKSPLLAIAPKNSA
jgi:transposase